MCPIFGERDPELRRAFVARKEEHDGSRPRVCQDFIPPSNQFSYNENASREPSYFQIDASRVRRSGPCQEVKLFCQLAQLDSENGTMRSQGGSCRLIMYVINKESS